MKVYRFEAETMIRSLANEWDGLEGSPTNQPNYLQFRAWLKRKGFGYLLNSREVVSAQEDAQIWFESELQGTSRR